MNREQHWDERFDLLDDFAMGYETAVTPMFSDDYLQEFYHFYRVRSRKSKLVPSEDGFHETLKDVSGDDCWRPIAEKTELLFGLPARVTVFEDDEELREEMGGRRGMPRSSLFSASCSVNTKSSRSASFPAPTTKS